MSDFQLASKQSTSEDVVFITCSIIPLIPLFYLPYSASIPLAIFLLSLASIYAPSYRKEYKQYEHEELKTLLAFYKILTANGFSDTHNPQVLKILKVIAPYISTKDVCHWLHRTHDSALPPEEPSREFLDIISKPPHCLIYSKDQVESEMMRKALVVYNRYNLWGIFKPSIDGPEPTTTPALGTS